MADGKAFHLLVGLVSQFQAQWGQRPEQPDPQGAKPGGPGVSHRRPVACEEHILSWRLLPPYEGQTRQTQSGDGNSAEIGHYLLQYGDIRQDVSRIRRRLLSETTEATSSQSNQKAGQTVRI